MIGGVGIVPARGWTRLSSDLGLGDVITKVVPQWQQVVVDCQQRNPRPAGPVETEVPGAIRWRFRGLTGDAGRNSYQGNQMCKSDG